MEKTINYKGYNIQIVQDSDPVNPRVDWDPAGTMICWHSRYNLGNQESWKDSNGKWKSKQLSDNYSEPTDLLYELAGVGRSEYQDKQYEECGEWKDMDHADLYRIIEEKGTIISKLFLYDHSGITISMSPFSCSFDSGQVGWIYMTKDTIEKEGWTPEQAMKYMKGEVKTYDDYLTGNVYGFRITDSEGDEIDSCYGFFGNPEESGCIDEAKGQIDALTAEQTVRDSTEAL